MPNQYQLIDDKQHGIKLAKGVPMSKATSLGAAVPAAGVVKMALERVGPVRSIIIPDEFAMKTALELAGKPSKYLTVMIPRL